VTEFIAALRQFRAPIAVIAIGFCVLQGLLSGISGAQAAARLAPGFVDLAVLCHEAGGDGGNGNAKAGHDCCVVCTTSWAAAGAPKPAVSIGRFNIAGCAPSCVVADTVSISRRAIRAGPSQAPPTLS
jgi:hypothetical protein